MNKKLFSIFIIPFIILLAFSGISIGRIRDEGIKKPEPAITWYPKKVEIDIFPGTVKTIDASFISKEDLRNVKFWIIPSLPSAKRFISVEPQLFEEITAGEQNSIQVVVSVPSDAHFRKYRALLSVVSEYTPRPRLKFSRPHLRFLRIIVNVVEPSVEEIPETISLPSEDRIYENPETKAIFIKDEIVVGFKEGTSEETIKNVVSEIGGVFLGSNEELNLYQIQVPITSPNELNPLIEQLKAEENIEIAFHHWISSIEKTPNDPDFNSDTWDEENPADKNWPQELIKLPSGWDIETGTAITKIAIIDNGFDFQHEDLKENIFLTGETNFVRDHGTHVAGILGARGNNNQGVAGTMWETGLLLYSAGLEDERLISDVAAAVGIKNAIENGARVINFSAGGYYKKTEDLKEANDFWKQYVIERTKKKGKDVLFVFAAGNDGKDHINHSPSSLSLEYDNVISVAAVDINGDLANYSNFGEVTIAASGGDGLPFDEGDVYSTLPGDTYGYQAGTSMATPFASGLAGLIWSEAQEKEINLTAAKVKEYIIKGAKLGEKQVPGHNFYVINAYQSVKLVVPRGLADTPWPMFQHDVRHTGQSEYIGSQTGNLKWWFILEGQGFSSSPVIGLDGDIYVGGTDGNLYAFSSNGTLKWKYKIGDYSVHSTSAVASDGTIYVGSLEENFYGKLYAINPDGTLKWSYPIGSLVDSSPVIGLDGTIYVGAAYPANKLYAINPDGTLKWSYKTGGSIYSSPALSLNNDVIYVGSNDYKLYALNLDGTLKWSYSTGKDINSSPTVALDGTIYIGSDDYKLYAINPDGTLKWSYNLGWGYPVRSTPAIGIDDTIYITSGISDRWYLYSINPDGTLKWKYRTYGYMASPIIGAGGTIYVGGKTGVPANGRFYAIASDGGLKWSKRFYLFTPIVASAAIDSDGTVYIGTLGEIKGYFYAFKD